MKRKIYTVLLLSVILTIQACNSDKKSTQSSDSLAISAGAASKEPSADMDTVSVKPIDANHFIKEATERNYKFIEAAKIAQNNGMDPMIGIFANKIIKDHTALSEGISSIAKDLRIAQPSGLNSGDQGDLSQLKILSGKKFDKEYMDMAVADYKATVDLFKAAAASSEIKIKTFAENALRGLEDTNFMAGDVRFNLKP